MPEWNEALAVLRRVGAASGSRGLDTDRFTRAVERARIILDTMRKGLMPEDASATALFDEWEVASNILEQIYAESVRRRLPAIMELLKREHGYKCCLVNQRYYESGGGQDNPPKTVEEAMQYVSVNPSEAVGICIAENGEASELIYQATQQQNKQ